MTSEALSGKISKIGQSGTNYNFKFGWSCRYNLEKFYGEGLATIGEEKDQAVAIANCLMCALMADPSNKMPDAIDRKEMYAILDDLGEEAVKQVWEVAKQSMGFINRLLGISDEDIEKLTQEALKNLSESQSQSQPIGEDSNA